jgi:FkbM family methyltransferase
MIAIYSVSTRDEDLALENAKWWNELGGCHNHQCFFFYDKRVTPDNIKAIQSELFRCFKDLYSHQAGALIDGWPEGANYMFRTSFGLLAARAYKYALWMEPDAVPLKEGWMDTIEAEYQKGGKPFMGGRVEGVYEGKHVPLHMTGIAVYPNPLYEHAGEAYRAFDMAWDIAAKDQIIPKAHFTGLFCHAWNHPGMKSMVEVDAIPPKAVIHHGVKDLSLITLLRQRRSGNLTIQPIKPKEPVAIVSGSPAPLSPLISPLVPKELDSPLPGIPVQASDAAGKLSYAEGGDAIAAARPKYGDIPFPGVHKLPDNTWVIEGDMISGIIKEKGKLDADEVIPKILPYIKPGDTVVDGGAFVGDHSIAYSDAVGKNGKVFCFEPNPLAYNCLVHNMAGRDNTLCYQMALGEAETRVSLAIDPQHQGGAYVGVHSTNDISMMAFDSSGLSPNLVKLDLEGYELEALKGMEKTISRCQPILVVEVNEEALQRMGHTQGDIFSWLVRHNYAAQILHDCSTSKGSLYDIIAFPAKITGQMA